MIDHLIFDAGHEAYASPAQADCLKAYLENGQSARRAARQLGKHHKTVQSSLQRLHHKAQLKGYDPGNGLSLPIPEMFFMERLTLNTDAEGNIKQAWPKLKVDDLKWATHIQNQREKLLEDYPLPPIPRVPKPKPSQNQIVPFFNIGDAHFNMLAQASVTGRDFTLEDAAAEIIEAFDILISETPAADFAVLNDMGDFTHHDNIAGVTSHSGHLLDTDQCYGTMLEVATDVFERVILRMLEKFGHVDVIINQGNHSAVNDLWMAIALRSRFRDNPRVTILDNKKVFIAYRIGSTLIMCHHGHSCPIKRMTDVMITDYRKDFGETEFHYIFTGHVHHRKVAIENAGVEIESFNNLAPNDKHHHEAGWRSKNAITRVDIDRDFGQVGRRKLPIEEIHARLLAKGFFMPTVFEAPVISAFRA
jgi:hypothetical protein